MGQSKNFGNTGRRSSVFWNHFTELSNRSSNPLEVGNRRGKCKYCNQVGNSGNMGRHLKNKHPAIYYDIMQENIKSEETSAEDLNYTEIEYVSTSDNEETNETELKKPINNMKSSEIRTEHLTSRRSYHSADFEERCYVFGQLLAVKMRTLASDQRLIAEKIINDTLHEAEMQTLNKNCGLSLVQTEPIVSKGTECDEKNVSTNSNSTE